MDGLAALESLEIEYAGARIFRQLLARRLFLLTAAVGVGVYLAHLGWPPMVTLLGLATEQLAGSMGIQSQSGIRPMVQSGCTGDGRDRFRFSSAVGRRERAEAPAGHRH